MVGVAVVVALGSCGSDGDTSTTNGGAEQTYEIPELAFEDLGDCGQLPKPKEFRCGSIEVPFERADPSLGTTEIGFAVRPPNDRDKPSLGAIFAVEGGPGYASTGTASAYTKVFDDLLDRRSLVLVDMRGTGRSGPVKCPDTQRGRAPDWIALSECARRLGPLASSYRTAAAADDIDDVREALGYERIALYGDSYGTFLAQSYAFRHPDSLDALVLDSAYPVRGESGWYPNIPRTGVRSLYIACRRSPSCVGDPEKFLAELAEHLRQTGRGVGSLIDALFDAGYSPPGSYIDVVDAGEALMRGDAEPWNKLTGEGKPGARHLRQYNTAGEQIVSCNDYPMIWEKPASETERRRQLEDSIRDYPNPDTFAPFTPREIAIGSEIGYLYCLTFPPPTDLYEPPAEDDAVGTEAPVLVVAGELDSVTTPHEGMRVADEFPNSEYYEVRNAGHVDALYYEDGAAAREIRRFLREHLQQ